jgi:DNA-directed RNA polymerase specialized sigma24 family protein
MDLRLIPLTELAAACGDETAKFLRREPARDDFCLELLWRAVGGDQAAWELVVRQYRGMVLAWVRQHPAAATARAGGEDDDYWVNRTFERFWLALKPERFGLFPGLAAILRYLKTCAHSVLLDEVRARRAGSLSSLDELPETTPADHDAADSAIRSLAGQQLWSAVLREMHDETERRVAYLSFARDLKPADIYRRSPHLFASVADVYRIKRNLLDRLRRNPEIRAHVA